MLSLVIALSVYQALLCPLINLYFIKYATNVTFAQSVKILTFYFLIFAIPLLTFEYFTKEYVANSFFARELFIATISFITLSIAFKASDVRKRLNRLKEI